ncbi:TetR/AcrR family transcriptional regulator [Nocardia sp. CDC159]|uniref:TetR/AcrR family transcriptional regulator n=1 Tax=Nocardia pulmonis TaxID=2951408 RepID=A0A9X2E244_9NOCA|nr:MULTISPECIES: TetR/AcrR family transcriptional regulator [Nocardia]MCM6772190.1 TetR/AcrR family transcriptional regulator [Nocardia pulmonis]MCM6785152.1 TetR/AcrR family transcriptional regulator [Nocardia sp. CDC159]
MTSPARRGRMPAVTDADIRRVARSLLVQQGPEAVTLRAIARELGITAPALYRYYASRDDLLATLRADVRADLAVELTAAHESAPDDAAARFFAICRGFRHWALTHSREFTLVFASPAGPGGPSAMRQFGEPVGRLFLTAAGRLLLEYEIITPPTEFIPEGLRADLTTFQRELLRVLAESGVKFPAEKLNLGVSYAMIQSWARLYGHVTLEAFGNYPLTVTDADALFDATLADIGLSIGLGDSGSR